MELTISLEGEFTNEVDRLRCSCFPGNYVGDTSEDPFDSRSQHILIRSGDDLAACARLTPGPDAVFETWTRGRAAIPTGPDVADLGRCAVGPEFRGSGLLRLLCVEGLLAAERGGFCQVVGAVIPGEPFQAMLESLGLLPSGEPVEEWEPSGLSFVVQPLACEVRQFADQWLHGRDLVRARLGLRGIGVRYL